MRAAILGGATGAKNVAVIIVRFPASACGGCTSGSNSITSLANINNYFNQMDTYYDEVSYGKIQLTFRFFGNLTPAVTPLGSASAVLAGSYLMANPMEYYGCGDEGLGCSGVTTPTSPIVSANGNYLIQDALAAARLATTGPTSTTGAGTFHAVLVVHAGNGNETTLGTFGDIWSIFYSQDPVITAGGGSFDQGLVVPETESSGIVSPVGVMCHEFGHELGLPDLYNTGSSGGTSVVGSWDLMDAGPYLGNGTNPAHMGIWDKMTLGWAVPLVVSSATSVSLTYTGTPTNDTGSSLKIPTPNGLAQEYFLVEYRSRTATGATYDKNIPGDGLLIWHIDDEITSTRGIGATPSQANTVNTGSPHYGVSIVTADGVTISGSNQGNAGNAFGNGSIFTSPKSNNFNGQPSGVTMVNISGVGTALVSASVAALEVSPSQSITKVINYPNPAGPKYAHPNGTGRTTIQFQLTRPAEDYSINLYTLSADLVRKIAQADITLNITRSTDLKWVYEYVWDLTNGSGSHVAPGVYLYLVRADGEKKSGKIVIIR